MISVYNMFCQYQLTPFHKRFTGVANGYYSDDRGADSPIFPITHLITPNDIPKLLNSILFGVVMASPEFFRMVIHGKFIQVVCWRQATVSFAHIKGSLAVFEMVFFCRGI